MLERTDVKQRHDEHHLRNAQLSLPLPVARSTQKTPLLLPFIELAKIIETTEQRCNIYGHEGIPPVLVEQHQESHQN